MKTVPVSTRLEVRETREIDLEAKREGLDRGSFLKKLIRRGFADIRFDRACEVYRRGEVTLSRAAEMADLPLRDFIARLSEAGLELNYGLADLKKDLSGL